MISTGTRSLKFMQRGAPAEGDAKTEIVTLPRAKVKDDGEWEIGRDVRESWGMGSEPIQNVIYEESYLPFLAPLEDSSPAAPAPGGGGRRSFGRFNKSLEPKMPDEETVEDMLRPVSPVSSESSHRPLASKIRPVSPASPGKGARRPGALGALRKPKHPAGFPLPPGGDSVVSVKPVYRPERDADARHPPQPAFKRPKGVDAPISGDRKGKKRQNETDTDGTDAPVEQSRRRKKPKTTEKGRNVEFIE